MVITTMLAICFAVIAAKPPDMIVRTDWISLTAFALAVPLFARLLFILASIGPVMRSCITATVFASIETCFWQSQINSGNYRITIPPEFAFAGFLVQLLST